VNDAAALRPLRVGEILDAGIKIYARHARTLMGITAVVVVPFQALSAVILLSAVTTASEVPHGGTFGVGARHTTSTGANAILSITGLVIDVLTMAACVKAVSDLYLEQPTGVERSLRFAVRRALPLLWLEVLAFVLLVIAFIALVVPGIYLYAAWSVATPALLIEDHRGWRALQRSKRLVRGRWWPTAGVLIVASLITSIVGGAIEALLIGVFLVGSSVVVTVLLVSLAAAVSAILTRPFSAAVRTVLYYDLRVRHEGYDIELLAEQLGIEPAALPPAPAPVGRESVGASDGPPFWPPPPGWSPPAATPADGDQ
jgi:hypothetical protein